VLWRGQKYPSALVKVVARSTHRFIPKLIAARRTLNRELAMLPPSFLPLLLLPISYRSCCSRSRGWESGHVVQLVQHERLSLLLPLLALGRGGGVHHQATSLLLGFVRGEDQWWWCRWRTTWRRRARGRPTPDRARCHWHT
jgi:hypothetical protein